jgi:hypothetical protein
MASEIIKAQGHRFKITNDGGYKKIYVEDAGEPGGWLFLRSVRPDQDATRMIEVGAESGPVHKWAHRFSRPGVKDTFDTYTDMVNELRRATTGAIGSEWHTIANTWLSRKRASGNRELAVEANRAYDFVEREHLARGKRTASRLGEKDTMAVEDRFYFGKGRKERFA